VKSCVPILENTKLRFAKMCLLNLDSFLGRIYVVHKGK
jgi:hypothetical protein